MTKTVLSNSGQIRISVYALLTVLLVILPAFYDVSYAKESFPVDLHDTLVDVEDGEGADGLDESALSNYHPAFTITCIPIALVRSLFLTDQTLGWQYLALLSFTVRPPPIL